MRGVLLLVMLPGLAWGAPSARHFEKLKSMLADEAKGSAIKKLEQPGPADVVVIGAAIDKAYPGTGVLRVLVDRSDVSYGRNGEKTFADFARAMKWLETPPPVDDLLRLLNDAQYDGVVVLEAVSPLRKTANGLELRFDHLVPGPGNPTPTTWELVIPKKGDLVLKRVK
jgi:hypothetical protein